MSAPQFFFPNSAQPGPHVERVRYTNDARFWFQREEQAGGAVLWRANGDGARDVAYGWADINDKTLVDCTGEVKR